MISFDAPQAEKPRVAPNERSKIDRNVLIWLNKFPDLPVMLVTTESQLAVDKTGMAVSAVTNAYINKSYILGGYQAEYNFTLIYRIKSGKSPDASLSADELLNQIGDWCIYKKPDLGKEIRVLKVTPTSQAELYALYENGDEDHHISIRIVYEVNV